MVRGGAQVGSASQGVAAVTGFIEGIFGALGVFVVLGLIIVVVVIVAIVIVVMVDIAVIDLCKLVSSVCWVNHTGWARGRVSKKMFI